MPAIVALITACGCITAIWAGTFNVAIRQEATIGWAVGRLHGVFEDVAFVIESQEEVLHNAVMVFGPCLRVQIPGDAQSLPYFADLVVVACHEFARRDALAFSINEDRGTVFVASRDHEHMVSG